MENITEDMVEDIVNKTDMHLGRAILKFTKENSDIIYQINTDTDRKETHGSIRFRSITVAQEMRKRGLGLDDLIIVCTFHDDDTSLPLLAAMYLGVKVLTASVDMVYAEICHILKMGTPKMVFCSKSISLTFLKAIKDLEIQAKIVVFDDDPESNFTQFSEFLNPTGAEDEFQATDLDPSTTTALILCSSGTTGLSKGICLNHRSLMIQLYISYHLQNIQKGRISLTYSSMVWYSGVASVFIPTLIGTTRLYSPSSFTPEKLFLTLNKYKPKTMLLTKVQSAAILNHPDIDNCDFSSIIRIVLGGSVISEEIIQALQSKLSNGTVRNTYGMTEMCGVITYLPKMKANSCGKILPWIKFKIVNPDTGKEIDPTEIGEFCCKSKYTMFSGYINNPKATAEAIDKDGWLHTGDLAHFDDEGYFYVVDRIKETFKYQNHQVIPAELEAIITNIDGVQACCVVGIDHPIDGHRPMAFVELIPGARVTEKQIMDALKENVSEYKQLKEGVVFMERLPVTHSNKINRREINRIKMDYVKK